MQGEIAFSYVSPAKQDGGRVKSRSELHVQECGDSEAARGGNMFYDRLALLELFLYYDEILKSRDDVIRWTKSITLCNYTVYAFN